MPSKIDWVELEELDGFEMNRAGLLRRTRDQGYSPKGRYIMPTKGAGSWKYSVIMRGRKCQPVIRTLYKKCFNEHFNYDEKLMGAIRKMVKSHPLSHVKVKQGMTLKDRWVWFEEGTDPWDTWKHYGFGYVTQTQLYPMG